MPDAIPKRGDGRAVSTLAASPLLWAAICLTCAFGLGWSGRAATNPDALSYLDLASEFLKSGPSGLVNTYWSPGYPLFISAGLALFRPSPANELLVLHVVNVAIFACTFLAFSYFLKYWLALHFPRDNRTHPLIVPLAYSTFLFFTLGFIGVDFGTPDMGVAAIVFGLAGIVCRLCLPGASARHYVALGMVLAGGYYMKAVMLPLGMVLIALFTIMSPVRPVPWFKLGLTVAVWLVSIAPFVIILSKSAGHPTFGETGKINYAWMVNGTHPFTGWTGDAHGANGIPLHPPRRLAENPEVLEFASPVPGTFPLWFDPSYWYAGMKTQFHPDEQTRVLKSSWALLSRYWLEPPFLWISVLGLWLYGLRSGRQNRLEPRHYWQLAWPAAACVLYSLVWVEKRFFGAFFVMAWLCLYTICLRRVNERVALVFCATLSLILTAPVAISSTAAIAIRDKLPAYDPTRYEKVGRGLQSAGVNRGDAVAIIGDPMEPFYVRYAGARVVANVPSADEFWHTDPETRASILKRLAGTGVKAVVARNRPEAAASEWIDIQIPNGQRYSILRLRADSGLAAAGELSSR
jgi:hypothetical protein